jgi:hypothetical protein
MEKAIKTTAKKATTVKNEVVAAVKTTVKEAKATAEKAPVTMTELVEDIKEMGQEIKSVATKNLDKIAEKVGVPDAIQKVKKVAAKANDQFMDMTEDFTEELKEKSAEFKSTTKKLAKEAIENIQLNDRLQAVKKAARNANNFALETSEELIETMTANGEKWQKVTEKALNSGLKLAEKQQNIMFNTLEAVKGQLAGSAMRFKKLIKNK